MAIIKNEQVGSCGIMVKRAIRCSGSGRFSINLPEHLRGVDGTEQVHGGTLSEVLAEWKKLETLYDASTTTTRKVILYNFKFSAWVEGGSSDPGSVDWREDHAVDNEGNVCFIDADDITFAVGTGLMVNACVYTEITQNIPGDKPRIKYKKVGDDEQLPSKMSDGEDDIRERSIDELTVIDWTQNRHDFFTRLNDALNALIWKLHDFTDQQTLLEFIDAGRLITGVIDDGKQEISGSGSDHTDQKDD